MKSFNRLTALSMAALSVVACDGRRTAKTDGKDATFAVEPLALKDAWVESKDDFGLPTSKTFQFEACFTDAISHGPITLTTFAVSDGQTEKSIRTLHTGCFTWNETHQVTELQDMRMMRIRRYFVAKEGFEGTVPVEFAFDPSDKGTLVDLRYSRHPRVEKEIAALNFETNLDRVGTKTEFGVVLPQGAATAFVSDVSLEFRGHDKDATEINRLLTLKPVQKFQMKMQPQFARRNLDGERVYLGLIGGQFRLRLLVLREGAADVPTLSDLVANYEGDVTVNDKGEVITDVSLKIHDTAAILSRNKLLVTLEPLGAGTLRAGLGMYTGAISPLKGNSVAVNLIPIKGEALSVLKGMNSILAESEKPVPRGIDLLETKGKMKSEVDGPLLDIAISAATDGQKQTASLASYCEKLYTPDLTATVKRKKFFIMRDVQINILQECLHSPKDYLVLRTQDFVEDVTGKPAHVAEMMIDDKAISISRSLSYTKTEGTNTGSEFSMRGGLSADLGASAGLKVATPGGAALAASPVSLDLPSLSFGLGAKFGIGKDWYYSKTYSKSTSLSVGTNVSQSQNLSVYADGYEIPVTARRCALVSSIMEVKGRPSGFFACDKKVSSRKIREPYYIVNHSRPASPFSDEESATNSLWRLTIRGEESYVAFEKMLTLENTVLHFEKAFTSPEAEASLLPDFKISQVYPGAISSK